MCFWMWRERRPVGTTSAICPSLLDALPSSTEPFLGITDRNACRECASCCGACRSWRYPSLWRSSVSIVVAVEIAQSVSRSVTYSS